METFVHYLNTFLILINQRVVVWGMTSWGRKFVDNGVKDEGVARGGLLILQLHY